MSNQKPKASKTSKTSKSSYAMPQAHSEKPLSQSQNRFQVLGTFPPLQPKETFAQKASSSQAQPYVDKAHTMKVQVLEPFQITNSGKPDLSKIFAKNKYFLQNHLDKTRKFYEFILVDTDSVEISHFQNESSTDICYSKCKIFKVLTHKMWGQSPDTHKMFLENFKPKSYDYYDYMDAWYFTFYFRSFDHSWFFHWGDEIKSQNDFPN